MKTTNQFRNIRISILFSLTVIFLFPFISKAQLNLDANGNVGVRMTPQSGISLTTKGDGSYTSGTHIVGLFTDGAAGAAGRGVVFGYNANGSAATAGIIRVANNGNLTLNPIGGYVAIGTLTASHLLTMGSDDAWKATSTWTTTSDRKTKRNIMPHNQGLNLIRQVNLVSFEYNGLANTINGQKGIGVVAQDFQNVFPNSVIPFKIGADSINSGETFLGVNFHELFISNVGAVKQLDSIVSTQNASLKAKVDSLTIISTSLESIVNTQNSKIAYLQSQISNCCTQIISEKSLINNEAAILSNTTAILYQNVPNPFNQQTNIQYSVPTISLSASIMVFDLTGKLIKTFPVTVFGNAAITINGNELSPGMFVYSLIVDGKIIDTKRMILTQ